MGRYHFDQLKFDYACDWIYQAIQWLQSEQQLALPIDLDRVEVLHVYAEALLKMSKSNQSNRLTSDFNSSLVAERYSDALKVIDSALKLRTDSVKLLLRKSEIESLIRTEPNAQPLPVGESYL